MFSQGLINESGAVIADVIPLYDNLLKDFILRKGFS